jgi:hypothetical protein
MTWTARSLQPDLPIIELVVSGSITHSDSDDMRAAVRAMLAGEGLTLVLYDATDLLHLPTSADIIQVADSLIAAHARDGLRNAHIRPTDPSAGMWTDHWVAVANNRGITTAVFRNRDEAVDWLLSE